MVGYGFPSNGRNRPCACWWRAKGLKTTWADADMVNSRYSSQRVISFCQAKKIVCFERCIQGVGTFLRTVILLVGERLVEVACEDETTGAGRPPQPPISYLALECLTKIIGGWKEFITEPRKNGPNHHHIPLAGIFDSAACHPIRAFADF